VVLVIGRRPLEYGVRVRGAGVVVEKLEGRYLPRLRPLEGVSRTGAAVVVLVRTDSVRTSDSSIGYWDWAVSGGTVYCLSCNGISCGLEYLGCFGVTVVFVI
jgi:hypothetical protein